jgi:hypothetical protein
LCSVVCRNVLNRVYCVDVNVVEMVYVRCGCIERVGI